MFHSKFFRNWEAEHGPECAKALFLDSTHEMFGREIVELTTYTIAEIHDIAKNHSRFTMADLARHLRSPAQRILIALTAMVLSGELVGPNPYAHEPTGPMDELVYQLPDACNPIGHDRYCPACGVCHPRCRICEVAPAAKDSTLCDGCLTARLVGLVDRISTLITEEVS